jgi:hypothetical protein
MFLLVVVFGTLTIFGVQDDTKKVQPAVTVYERHELFRSKDMLFHHSYPVSWFVVDTTQELASREAKVKQTWTVSDEPVAWQIKADFKLRETNTNFRNLQQGLCQVRNLPCEKESLNGFIYSKVSKTNPDGTQLISYEGLQGTRTVNIDITIRPTSQQKVSQWNTIAKSFRFFK